MLPAMSHNHPDACRPSGIRWIVSTLKIHSTNTLRRLIFLFQPLLLCALASCLIDFPIQSCRLTFPHLSICVYLGLLAWLPSALSLVQQLDVRTPPDDLVTEYHRLYSRTWVLSRGSRRACASISRLLVQPSPDRPRAFST